MAASTKTPETDTKVTNGKADGDVEMADETVKSETKKKVVLRKKTKDGKIVSTVPVFVPASHEYIMERRRELQRRMILLSPVLLEDLTNDSVYHCIKKAKRLLIHLDKSLGEEFLGIVELEFNTDEEASESLEELQGVREGLKAVTSLYKHTDPADENTSHSLKKKYMPLNEVTKYNNTDAKKFQKCTLVIGGLPQACTIDAIKEKFPKCQRVFRPKSNTSEELRSYAFMEFTSDEDAQEVLKATPEVKMEDCVYKVHELEEMSTWSAALKDFKNLKLDTIKDEDVDQPYCDELFRVRRAVMHYMKVDYISDANLVLLTQANTSMTEWLLKTKTLRRNIKLQSIKAKAAVKAALQAKTTSTGTSILGLKRKAGIIVAPASKFSRTDSSTVARPGFYSTGFYRGTSTFRGFGSRGYFRGFSSSRGLGMRGGLTMRGGFARRVTYGDRLGFSSPRGSVNGSVGRGGFRGGRDAPDRSAFNFRNEQAPQNFAQSHRPYPDDYNESHESYNQRMPERRDGGYPSAGFSPRSGGGDRDMGGYRDMDRQRDVAGYRDDRQRDMGPPREMDRPRDMGPPREMDRPRDMGPPRNMDRPRDMGPPRDFDRPREVGALRQMERPRDMGPPRDIGGPREGALRSDGSYWQQPRRTHDPLDPNQAMKAVNLLVGLSGMMKDQRKNALSREPSPPRGFQRRNSPPPVQSSWPSQRASGFQDAYRF